jgi:cell division protein FtsN
MSKNMVGKAPAPKKPTGKGGGMLIGILVGMALGLMVAGGVAWYLMKLPSPFTKVEQQPDLPPVDKPLVAPPPKVVQTPPAEQPTQPNAPAAASAPVDGKPRFEFYKVLTDKKDTSVPLPKVEDKSFQSPAAAKEPLPDNAVYQLQVASYSTEAEAENQKAKLAMQGMVATIQSVFVPEKGQRYRVRLGPYHGAAEMEKARAALKQIGVDATPMRTK